MTAPEAPITERQAPFIRQLANERVLPEDVRQRLLNGYEGFSKAKASETIKWLLRQPVKPGQVPNRIAAMPQAATSRSRTVAAERVNAELSRQRTTGERPARSAPAEEGAYQKDGVVYIVISNKQGTRRYAKKIVESPPRMTESGEVVDFEFERSPGMVFVLTAADRLEKVEIERLMTKYKRCIRCHVQLKAAKSVARAAGKRCATKLGLI
jgi:hypothetical protein